MKDCANLFRLSPACKDTIWGGMRLSKEYGKAAVPTRIAETWELSLHPDGLCRVAEGEYAGKTLKEVLGREDFPTLIKLIDAQDDLSIQVHPAKTEMWYIVDCEEGATLIYGLKEAFCEESFRKALAEGRVEELLNTVPVHRGDVFFIPSGMVHAIGKGILIAEIQQNSNITYRVYDYGRLQNGKPRELHVEQAMAVIRDFTPEQLRELRFSSESGSATACEGQGEMLAECPYFRTYRYALHAGEEVVLPNAQGWQCLLCVEGTGSLNGQVLRAGDTFFAEEGVGALTLCSQDGMTVLVTDADE